MSPDYWPRSWESSTYRSLDHFRRSYAERLPSPVGKTLNVQISWVAYRTKVQPDIIRHWYCQVVNSRMKMEYVAIPKSNYNKYKLALWYTWFYLNLFQKLYIFVSVDMSIRKCNFKIPTCTQRCGWLVCILVSYLRFWTGFSAPWSIIVRYVVVSSLPPDIAWQQGTTTTCSFQPPILCCMLLPLCNWQIDLTIKKKLGNVRITLHWGASVQPLLQWTSNMYYIFWVCIYSLSYPARNPHVFILTSMDCPAVQSFSTLTHKRHDFRKKKKGYKMSVLISSRTFVWNIYHI